jgi:hypothetical protein
MGVSAFGCRRSGKAITDEHGSTRINPERGGRAGAEEEMVRRMVARMADVGSYS